MTLHQLVMRVRSTFALLSLSASAVACGGSASQPSAATSTLQLQTGNQLLDLTGFDLSSDPDYPPCSNPGTPRAGKRISTSVFLEQRGQDWVAHSIPPDAAGTLELRFHDAGSYSMGGETIAGTISGGARDITYLDHPAKDVRIAFAGVVQIDGRVTGPSLSMGRLSGTMIFADSSGTASTCGAVSFLLQPSRGIY